MLWNHKPNEQQLAQSALIQSFVDEESGWALFAHEGAVQWKKNQCQLALGFSAKLEIERLTQALYAHLSAHGISEPLPLSWDFAVESATVQSALRPYPNIKNIIAVVSGKGGVGKSTVSVNLALALQQQGAKVGIMDADIYGPSQAMMLGGAKTPTSKDGKTMQPIIRHGLQSISMGDLVKEYDAMVWRGPIVSQTLMQLIKETQWQDLDYLVIDMPPGTGDVQLTLSQQIPVSGAVIVTTPQDIALLDARRAKVMFDKVAIRTLGIIENMSHHCCPNCGHQSAIFGTDGGKALCERYRVPLLAQIPLDIEIREHADRGTPIVLNKPQSALAQSYQRAAFLLMAQLRHGKKQSFPKITQEPS